MKTDNRKYIDSIGRDFARWGEEAVDRIEIAAQLNMVNDGGSYHSERTLKG